MNRRFFWITIAVAGILAVTSAFAQQHRPYDQIMKDVGARWANLKKNLDSNDGAGAAADAAKMQALFAEVEAFWAPLETGDAVGFAKNARTGAATLETAAKANDIKAAQAAYAAVQKNCGNCHYAHRDDTGKGGFVIRP